MASHRPCSAVCSAVGSQEGYRLALLLRKSRRVFSPQNAQGMDEHEKKKSKNEEPLDNAIV